MSGSMDDVDAKRFQRIKFQYAKRLVTESFSRFEDVERKGLNDEQLVRVFASFSSIILGLRIKITSVTYAKYRSNIDIV